jgi:hypothetical protein
VRANLLALHLAAPLLLPLDIVSISLVSHNTRTHTPHTLPKEEEQGFAVAVFLGTHNGYIFFSVVSHPNSHAYNTLNRHHGQAGRRH